jgi:UDP-perosamine 4-acetyltransferase
VTDAAAGQLVIVGAGGHAKVIVELLRAAHPGLALIGFTDRDAAPRTVLGLPVLGGDEMLQRLRAEGVEAAFVALGDNAVRAELGDRLQMLGYRLPTVVSPRAAVSPSARLGVGVAVMAGAVINADAEIAELAIINTGAVVDHDVQVGRAAHLGPGCAVAGGVRIGARTLLGVGASVAPGVTIGADVVVGAGACVVQNLPDGVVAVGVPARPVRSAPRI